MGKEAVQALLEVEARTYPQDSTFNDLWQQYRVKDTKNISIKSNFTLSQQRGVLSYPLEYTQHNLSLTEHNQGIALVYLCSSKMHRPSFRTLNEHFKSGETLLCQAAASGNHTLAQLLLRMDAEVDLTNENKETPLLKAVIYGHSNVVKLLLERGAKIDCRCNCHIQVCVQRKITSITARNLGQC